MREQKLERKMTADRHELANFFRQMSEDIRAGKFSVKGEQVMLPPGESHVEVEFKTKKDTGELEIEIKWNE